MPKEERTEKSASRILPEQPKVPNLYANSVSFDFGVYDLTLHFKVKRGPDLPEEPLVDIQMSPQHAKVLSHLLKDIVGKYEQKLGEINLPEDLKKELHMKGFSTQD